MLFLAMLAKNSMVLAQRLTFCLHSGFLDQNKSISFLIKHLQSRFRSLFFFSFLSLVIYLKECLQGIKRGDVELSLNKEISGQRLFKSEQKSHGPQSSRRLPGCQWREMNKLLILFELRQESHMVKR